MLVTVRGTIIRPLQDDTPYGDRLWIEDSTGQLQIYVPKSTGINPSNLPFLKVGQTIQVTGLSSQFDQSDEIIPRSAKDIEKISANG
jgi:DNA/RNA endonuclease YhcR with UshA esterase domain